MKGRMFDVVDYIARRYGAVREAFQDMGSLRDELFDVGFQEEEVERALAWLQRLQAARVPASGEAARTREVTRVASAEEERKLTAAARNYLLRLERAGVLDAALREAVYERATGLDVPEVGLREARVLVALLLEASSRRTVGMAGGMHRAGNRKFYH
jgi:Smg protein